MVDKSLYKARNLLYSGIAALVIGCGGDTPTEPRLDYLQTPPKNVGTSRQKYSSLGELKQAQSYGRNLDTALDEMKKNKETAPYVADIVNYLSQNTYAAPSLESALRIPHAYDVDGNRVVNIVDLVTVATNMGRANYNPAADVDGDGKVDIKDLVTVAVHYGETITADTTAPVISNIDNVAVNEGSVAVPIDVSVSDDVSKNISVVVRSSNPDYDVGYENGKIIFRGHRTNQPDYNGTLEFIVEAKDEAGNKSERRFNYVVNPMTDIRGGLIDTDNWEHNSSLDGYVEVRGRRVKVNDKGLYEVQNLSPAQPISVVAYYTDQKGNPMSFVRTVNNVDGRSDVSDLDVAVVSYLNLGNASPEDFRLIAWEANFRQGGNTNYTGAKTLRQDMEWLILKYGPYGDSFSDEQIAAVLKVVNLVNSYMKRPLPVNFDMTNDWSKRLDEYRNRVRMGKITISRWIDGGGGAVGGSDYDRDGRIDSVGVNFDDPTGAFADGFIREEIVSAVASEHFVESPSLNGKTIMYEWGPDIITLADEKLVRFLEAVKYDIGGLKPKMPLDEVLRLQ